MHPRCRQVRRMLMGLFSPTHALPPDPKNLRPDRRISHRSRRIPTPSVLLSTQIQSSFLSYLAEESPTRSKLRLPRPPPQDPGVYMHFHRQEHLSSLCGPWSSSGVVKFRSGSTVAVPQTVVGAMFCFFCWPRRRAEPTIYFCWPRRRVELAIRRSASSAGHDDMLQGAGRGRRCRDLDARDEQKES